MIASYVKDNHRQWNRWVHEFCFAINSALQESTSYTPAEIATGHKLKGPMDRHPDPDHSSYNVIERQQSLLSKVKENVTKAQERQAPRFVNVIVETDTAEDLTQGQVVLFGALAWAPPAVNLLLLRDLCVLGPQIYVQPPLQVNPQNQLNLMQHPPR
ncbi:piezo-type mechanosensitive ion channel component 2-like [Tachysurus ichikawai]